MGDDFDEYWGPRERTWSPPGWGEAPVAALETPPSVDQQKPWATCPDCKEHPEALYIDCREAHMLRQYNDPVTGVPVPLLPITYPFRSRVATADVLPGEEERKSTLKGAPKLVKSAAVRRLLKRWSGHVPVTKRYAGKKVEIIPGPRPEPLKAAEVEVRKAFTNTFLTASFLTCVCLGLTLRLERIATHDQRPLAMSLDSTSPLWLLRSNRLFLLLPGA